MRFTLLLLTVASLAFARGPGSGVLGRQPGDIAIPAPSRRGDFPISKNGSGFDLLNATRLDLYADCTGSTDGTAGITAALSAAMGGILLVPSKCVPLVASPGAGSTNFTLGSGTTIVCEDNTAGFKLAAKKCVGGTYNGAACSSSTTCDGGGTCTLDGNGTLSGIYAPTAGQAYGLFVSSSGTKNDFINCSIFTQQMDGFYICAGGTNANHPCNNTCAAGSFAGYHCLADADCGSGQTCTKDTTCTGGGGTCNAAPQGAPSGTGKINVLDWSATIQGGDIDNIMVWDLQTTDFAIKAGVNQFVERVVIPAYTFTYANPVDVPTTVTAWAPTSTAAKNVGLIVVTGSTSSGVGSNTNVANGLLHCSTGPCVTLNSNDTDVEHMQIVAIGGATGIVHNSSDDLILSNIINCPDAASGSVGIDTIPYLQSRTPAIGGADTEIAANGIYTCQTGYRLAGIGVTFFGNIVLFPTVASVQIGNAGTYAFLTGHSSVIGNFLGNIGTCKGVLAVNPGNRCQDGSKAGETCTADNTTACPGASGCNGTNGCCAMFVGGSLPSSVAIERNNILCSTGPDIDLSAWLSSGGTPEVNNVLVSDNMCMGDATSPNTGTCIGLPTDPNEVVSIQLKDNLTTGVTTAYSGALTSAKGRTIHGLAWFFPGVPTAGVQAARAVIPRGLSNCQATDFTVTLGMVSQGGTSTFNVKRCTSNCTGTTGGTYTKLFTNNSDTTIVLNRQTTDAGVPTNTCSNANVPWACCDNSSGGTGGCGTTVPLKSVLAGDQFVIDIASLGTSVADVTALLTIACDN